MNQRAEEILNLFLEKVEQSLPGLLEGFYLYGSIVLNDFYPKKSDIDFIAISKKRLLAEEFKLLQKIHRAIQSKFPKPNLNGIYIRWEDLGKDKSEISPFPYFYNGKMYKGGYFECNKVTWYELKYHGLVILGKPIKSLDFQLDEVAMVEEIQENLKTYWVKWQREHANWFFYKSYLLLFFEILVEWGVLGVARQYYTFQTKKITSKKAAGVFCLENTPSEFHEILKEAIRIREGKSKSIYSSIFKRRKAALAFMKYIIELKN